MGKRSTGRPAPPVLSVYIEGDISLRRAFQEHFFAPWRERLRGRFRFRVVTGESNTQTADKWKTQRSTGREVDIALLLIDSEGPVPGLGSEVPDGCCSFLTHADLATNDVFFMVQLMEAWFLTRPEALVAIYGKGFKKAKLPRIPTDPSQPAVPGEHLEAVSKKKIEKGLDQATKDTAKGRYNRANAKTTIAPRMLEVVDLNEIAKVSFHANRLRERLESEVKKLEPAG